MSALGLSYADVEPRLNAPRCQRCFLRCGLEVNMSVGHRCPSIDAEDVCPHCEHPRMFTVTMVDSWGTFSELAPCDCVAATQRRAANMQGGAR